MSKSSLVDTKEAHLAILDNSKQQEDVKLYGQLPAYDDLQCYDLGQEDILRQVAQRIYANYHKPLWRTLKRHLFSVRSTGELFREIKSISENDKKDDSEQERMFGRLAKTPIDNTFNELVGGVDFVDYGDLSTFVHIRDTFSRFSAISFSGTKKQEEQTAEMVRASVISNWVDVSDTPEIMAAGKDSRFIGGFCVIFAMRIT